MCYYPLATLMSGGLRNITVVTSPDSLHALLRLWGDGHQWGVRLDHVVQTEPDGLAAALELAYRTSAADWEPKQPTVLMLGDNLLLERKPFVRRALARALAAAKDGYASIFTCPVKDPRAYGVAVLRDGRVLELAEKPANPLSRQAVIGLYVYPPGWPSYAAKVQPSSRGEREITDLNRLYLAQDKLLCHSLGASAVWLDAGTPDRLLAASELVRDLQRQGPQGSPEAAAHRQGWLSYPQLEELAYSCGPAYRRLLLAAHAP